MISTDDIRLPLGELEVYEREVRDCSKVGWRDKMFSEKAAI